MNLSRTTIQGILAVLIVGGTLLIIVLNRNGQPPYEFLFALVGGLIGYYFGYDQSGKKNGNGNGGEPPAAPKGET